jgi:hypothetical protein
MPERSDSANSKESTMTEHVEHMQERSPYGPQKRRCDLAIAMGVIAVSVLAAAIAMSTLVSSAPGAQTAQAAEGAPETQPESIYEPSQYVNQAKEREEHIEAF